MSDAINAPTSTAARARAPLPAPLLPTLGEGPPASTSYDPHHARRSLEALVRAARGFAHPEMHYLLWEACLAAGEREDGLSHLRRAMALDPLRSHPIDSAAPPRRTVLALAAPGDFQANLPLAMLFDGGTALHTLHLADAAAILANPLAAVPARLPHVDAVFVAVAEDESHGEMLRAADALAAAIGAPVINRGSTIAALGRENVARRLVGIPGAIVPAQRARSRAGLEAMPPTFPAIIRPLGSHAGRGLARVACADELATYLGSTDACAFHVAPFVDFRGAGGMYRKCRVIFVEGRPYPLHLAIHDDWAVWYYNAEMSKHAERRAEEARFLADMEGAIGINATRALYAIAAEIGLDYFGLDAGLMPDGRLLVFEIETGMIVHDPGLHAARAERHQAFLRIRTAVERMIDHRASRRLQN